MMQKVSYHVLICLWFRRYGLIAMSSISEWKYHVCKFTFLAMASHCTKEFHSLTTLKEFHGLIAAACSVPGPWHINKSCILSFYLSRAQLSAPVWFRLVCLIFPAIVFWPINWQFYVVNVVRPMFGNVFWRRKRFSSDSQCVCMKLCLRGLYKWPAEKGGVCGVLGNYQQSRKQLHNGGAKWCP